MSIFSELQNLINEHGSSTILRERLALLSEQIAIVEYKLKEITDERDTLKGEIAALQQQMAHYQDAARFVQRNGLLWLPLAEGGFEAAPYCPKCHLVMHQFPPGLARGAYWVCTPCRFQAGHCHPPT